MKIYLTTFTVLALAATSILAGCSTPAEKVAEPQKNVNEANADLVKANEDYLADIAKYREETNDRIEANAKSLADFKARTAADKKEAKAEYQEKVAALEKKNSDLRKTMDDYKADGKESWEKFKIEFNRDLEELRIAFQDLTIRNTQ